MQNARGPRRCACIVAVRDRTAMALAGSRRRPGRGGGAQSILKANSCVAITSPGPLMHLYCIIASRTAL
jgi:hypothetical protein